MSGVAQGCKDSLCALIGGETAEMPSLYKIGDFDAAGCAIGAIEQGRVLLPAKSDMVIGDQLLGLASSGCHSNGFRFEHMTFCICDGVELMFNKSHTKNCTTSWTFIR